MALNVVIISGRLTRDPELRQTSSGKSVASFTLAVDRDYVRAGEDRETDFIPVIAWEHSADFVQRWFHKGSAMNVKGRLQIRKWTDSDGNNRTSAEVVADSVYFGEKARQTAEGQTNAEARESAPAAQETPAQASTEKTYAQGRFRDLNDDGELPF